VNVTFHNGELIVAFPEVLLLEILLKMCHSLTALLLLLSIAHYFAFFCYYLL